MIKKYFIRLLLFVWLLYVTDCSKFRKEQNRVSTGKSFAVSTDHPLASEVALGLVEKNCNLIDAFVGASFAISVLRPQSTGLLGGGFAVVHWKGSTQGFDFRERAPRSIRPDLYLTNQKPDPKKTQFGPLSIGVPGIVPGLLAIHKKSGKCKWSEVLEPAKQIAMEGFPLYPDLVQKSKILPSEIRSRVFQNKVTGDIWRNESLANTIEILQSEPTSFQNGKLSNTILKSLSSNSTVTRQDLENYKVKSLALIKGRAFGRIWIGLDQPSSGIHLIRALEIFDAMRKSGKSWEESFIPPLYFAYKDRYEFGGDIQVNKQLQDLEKRLKSIPKESFETTHLSLVDSEGNAVSSTQSINGLFGSHVYSEESGLFWNNTIDDFSFEGMPNSYGLIGKKSNAIAPGKTPMSSMSPLVALDENNRAVVAIGAPGGSQIPSSIYNVLVNHYDRGLSWEESVRSPRVHYQFRPNEVLIEEAYSNTIPEVWKKFPIQYGKHRAKVFVASSESSDLIGVTDPRGDGEPKSK